MGPLASQGLRGLRECPGGPKGPVAVDRVGHDQSLEQVKLDIQRAREQGGV